jgi:hypothetical protein
MNLLNSEDVWIAHSIVPQALETTPTIVHVKRVQLGMNQVRMNKTTSASVKRTITGTSTMIHVLSARATQPTQAVKPLWQTN